MNTTTPADPINAAIPASADEGRQTAVRISNLVKHFKRADGQIVRAVDDVSLDVHVGEFVVLLGPSGCGKTTLLRCIAGLEHADSGRIETHGVTRFDAARGVNLPPEKRNLNMIFQSYALWPHMTVFNNVAYPLRNRKVGKSEIKERVAAILKAMEISDLAGQHPGQLSGGQQQRVALARALVGGDDLVLFDEPLSNVDAKVRDQLRRELLSMQREFGFAAVYVTHDQAEAMELAHNIAVLGSGKLVQFGPPAEIYDHPATGYVARFIGQVNELRGTLGEAGEDASVMQTAIGPVHAQNPSAAAGEDLAAVFRPEACQLHASAPSAQNSWAGRIRRKLYVGTHTEYVVTVDGGHTLRVWTGETSYAEGDAVWVSVPASAVRVVGA